MEAMACGCHVFSSVNGGLSDYLDPGFNCEKIAGYALDYDCQRILGVVKGSRQWRRVDPNLLAEYRRENILERLRVILLDINEFFDYHPSFSQTIEPLTQRRIAWLKFKSLLTKVKNKFKSS